MMLQYVSLSRAPQVFQTLTGLRVAEFDTLLDDVLPRYAEAERARLSRSDRQRDIGGGHPFELDARDQRLLSVIWLRQYPIQVVLGSLPPLSWGQVWGVPRDGGSPLAALATDPSGQRARYEAAA